MIAEAAEEFKGLSELVLRALPDSLLQPLLTRLRLDTAQPAPLSARQWLWEADPALRSVVAKETLQWRRNTLSQVRNIETLEETPINGSSGVMIGLEIPHMKA